MAQNDLVIANQSFPSFRTDLNNALSAIQTTHSGTSRPTGAVAGQIWLDTTSATSPTLKYYDGADDISLATLDHSANTVNWLDSTVSVTGLTTTATGTVLTLSDSSLTSSVNLILQNQKEIRFSETTANGTNYVGFKAPASLSADKIWILPSADGTAGQFLKTDGAGNLSFDSLSFSTPLAVIGNATAGSEIRLPEDTDNGSNYVAIKAPDTIASNLTLTLPSADGSSGQVLQTNGSGVLSFAGVSASAGQVIQVVNTLVTTTYTYNSQSYAEISSDFRVTITPSSASNKIIIICSSNMSTDHQGSGSASSLKFMRNIGGGGDTNFNEPTSFGSRNKAHFYFDARETGNGENGRVITFALYDSPSTTSQIVYTLYARNRSANAIFFNRLGNDSDNDQQARTVSNFYAIEIKG